MNTLHTLYAKITTDSSSYSGWFARIIAYIFGPDNADFNTLFIVILT